MNYFRPDNDAIRQRYADHPHGHRIANLLGGATSNLDSARFGERLYALLYSSDSADYAVFKALGERHETIEFSANCLVFRSVKACLDLCAAAAWYACGGMEPDRTDWEREMKDWCDDEGKRMRRDDCAAGKWVSSVLGSHTWRLLKEGREKLTHRLVPRHVIGRRGGPGGLPARTNSTLIQLCGQKHDLLDLHPKLVQFGIEKRRELGSILANSAFSAC